LGFRIREIEAECKFSSTLTVEALARAIPPDAIAHVLAEQAATHQRERKLSMPVVVWLIIALHLYTTLSIGAMLSKLARGLRFIWPHAPIALPFRQPTRHNAPGVIRGRFSFSRHFRMLVQDLKHPREPAIDRAWCAA